jgi:outer membrane protein OmpA-like peptidoglycan-associated protein
VAAWLRQQVGVRQRQITTSGKGEAEPIAPNTRPDGGDDPAGRARNRRVELIIANA